MARIPEQTIDRIRDAADILDVVSDYVQLKRRGRNWFGLCPFHQEKTPSFSINQDKQIFHCFGCGKGGNAISFIMEVERLDFVAALKQLAERTGIDVQLTSDSDPREKALVQQIMDLYELAASRYQQALAGADGAPVRDYLQKRGITPETWSRFRIGYVPDKWDDLLKSFNTKDFSREALNQSGLFIAGDRGPYDRFRGRIMFPICNATGKVLAMAGRVFGTEEQAKYINSPETPLYHKSEVLYGLHLAKQALREAGQSIIVEGYLDLIQLHQAGITNVVAVSGTALTDRHARELRRYGNRVILAYDGDNAGVQAAVRGGYTLLQVGLDPRIVELPVDLDPDDWVQQEGPQPFRTAVEEALPLLEFQQRHFPGDLRQTGDLRRFLDDTLRELAPIRDPLTRELLLKQLAELSGVDERRLHQTLEAIPVRRPQDKDPALPKLGLVIEPTRSHRAQMALIRLAFEEHQDVLNLLADEVRPELFNHPALRQIWELIRPLLATGTIPDPGQLVSRLPDPDLQQLLSGLLIQAEERTDQLSLAIDCLTVLYRESLQDRIEARRRDLKTAEQGTGQPPEDLLEEVAALQRSLTELGHQFDKYRA